VKFRPSSRKGVSYEYLHPPPRGPYKDEKKRDGNHARRRLGDRRKLFELNTSGIDHPLDIIKSKKLNNN